MSARLINNVLIAANAAMLYDRLQPVQEILREAGMARFPGVNSEATAWTNGALYGMVATYALLSKAEDLGVDEVDAMSAVYCEFFTEVIDNHGGNADAAIHALIPNLK
jgi:hypothetical protein